MSSNKLNLLEKRMYERYKLQIDNCVCDIPEKKQVPEIKRIIKELNYLKKHTSFTYIEFFMLGFAYKCHREWYEYLPDKSSRTIYERLRIGPAPFYTGDKYKVYEKYKKYFHRDACLVKAIEDKDILFSFISRNGKVMLKPLCGSLGEDIIIVKSKDIVQFDSFFDDILKKYPDGCIAEELIVQEESLAKLNPTSVNTLRITTVRMDDRVEVHSFLRVGKMFSLFDNIARGGIVCALNQETGEITRAMDHFGNRYEKHPHTGMPLVGYTVPRFKEAVELAKELTEVIPNLRYMGWDLALTDSGWVMVELNAKAGIYCVQQTLGRGIKKDFEKIFEELGKPIDFPDAFKKNFK